MGQPPPPRRPRARIDVPDNLWEHAFETGGIAVAAVFALAAVSSAGRWPALPLDVLLAGAAVGALIVAHLITGGRSLTTYLLCWAVLLPGWYAWARHTTPWSIVSVVELLAPAAVLTPLGAVLTAKHARHAAEEHHREVKAIERVEVGDWAGLFSRFGVDGLAVVAVTPTRSGRMVHLRLPEHGRVVMATLLPLADRIEVARRLPRGSVRFEEGKHAADVIMHVTERDVLGEVVPFPDTITPATISEPKSLGMAEDGALAHVLFREVAALLAGVRGSGKSNLLNVITAHLAMCVDVVIFAIDTKNRFAAPWLLPWLRGQCPRPVIDWIATTKAEAALMLEATEAAIRARSGSLAGDGEKITPTATLPAIILVVDEVAYIFGLEPGSRMSGEVSNSALQRSASRIVGVGRSEAIDPIFATLRATVSMMGGGDLKSQCDVRMGLGVNSRADAASIIPDDQRASAALARINQPGVMLLSVKGTAVPVVVKVFRLEPPRIAAIAEATGWLRPEPDQLTAAAMGEAYARRWDRFAPIAEAWLAGTDTTPAAGDGGGAVAVAAPPAPAPPQRRPPGPVDVDREFEALTGGLDDPEARLHPSHKRMREILAERGPAGATPSILVAQLEREGKAVRRETVQRWLAADRRDGLVRDTGTGLWHWITGPGHGAP